jgi:membrane protease YdiL (CAAX protease family)
VLQGGEVNTKLVALAESVAVFALTLLLVVAVGISPAGAWVRRVTHRSFLEYAVMIAVPLLLLLVSRRDLASYGISLRNPRYHLKVTITAFIPVAMADVVLRFVDYTALGGALILTATWIAVLVVLGLLLRRMPAPGANTALVTLPLIALVGGHGQQATPVNAFSALLFYVFFLGLGEELLFRGYIQSRLNIAFGRPFKLFGVPWGWGAVIASALFGLMHVLNLAGMISQSWQLTPWWGLWTFSFGLVMAFVREKTGSIVAPTLLHGLPQGIAYAFMGL